MPKIAIIGAGLSGLTIGQNLQSIYDVHIFEKSRSLGGRIASKVINDVTFDHGAQFFKANTKEFKAFIQPMIEEGIIQEWHGKFVEFDGNIIRHSRSWSNAPPHYVGSPSMNAIGKYLAQGLNIRKTTKITQIIKDTGWLLVDDQDNAHGPFDWVISTIPAAQAFQIMPANFEHLQDIKSTQMLACFSLMTLSNEHLTLPFDAALVKNQDISWISAQHSKPNRVQKSSLLTHSTNRWAQNNFDLNETEIINHLKTELSYTTGINFANNEHYLHKWRYANVKKQHNTPYFLDRHNKLMACGDWCIQGRIEAAFLSGLHAASAIQE
ncbi:FAD-dependent oxidoreductase [Candidatus Comchoanobacter bicostacola]|uniref:FAD-dependent oxidoreductase n=1 Tax=Candidatus Comchoanobacter bicostacola TaxID=2919598 RepID=A0ABY5DKN1_9GAMM|nr:FAD-dependent oxidoreductase [Candidatus Comchoanobacter bicostacola]UTC24710.1 FAD-dependent oxidoreductase [Candidatus Comchoanobacter bicostacola]